MFILLQLYYSCVRGTLVEINDELVKNPSLLRDAVRVQVGFHPVTKLGGGGGGRKRGGGGGGGVEDMDVLS